MHIWGDEHCSLVRFNLSRPANLDLDDILHDDIAFIAFEGCGWSSRNGPLSSRHEQPSDLIVRPAGESVSITAEWIARTSGLCREIHISPQRLKGLAEEEESPIGTIDLHCGMLAKRPLGGQLMALHGRFEADHETLEASER
jgi:hypothetical protein